MLRAIGRCDGFWELDLHPWDTAAGRVILEEADVTDSAAFGRGKSRFRGTAGRCGGSSEDESDGGEYVSLPATKTVELGRGIIAEKGIRIPEFRLRPSIPLHLDYDHRPVILRSSASDEFARASRTALTISLGDFSWFARTVSANRFIPKSSPASFLNSTIPSE